ncbi:MAG TPA: ABC transporter permease [Blastocatellia bacterium]|nr:ABC transporter permease [Blastocatellia bacterium]
MNALWQDLRYGARMLWKRLGFTSIAAITLALGIGASAAIFSVVNVVILNPFPYRDHTRLFLVRQNLPKIGVSEQARSSGPEFSDYAKSQAFEKVAAYETVSRNLTGGQEPERVAPGKVSAEFFSMLGIEPLIGRVILPEDQGPKGERVLVISHGLWQRRFGGDPGVLGKTVALDDEPYTIIGVMPPRFWFEGRDAWFPFPFNLGEMSRSARTVTVIAKLKPSVTMAQAGAELELLARQNEQSFAATNPEYVGRGLYLQPYREFVYGAMRRTSLILFGAVGVVLLIACANIANLLLARAGSRSPEIAIRTALGAGRFRIVRQLLTEGLLLSILGGLLGALIAVWGVNAIVALSPSGNIPDGVEISVNTRVMFFALGVSLLTSLIFGLWPALQVSRPETQESLKSGAQRTTAGRRNRRMQRALVVAEVSLSLVLLVMAGLMLRSFAKLTNVDTGFNTENLLSMRLTRSPAKSEGGRQMAAFFQQLIDRVSTVPGVKGVAVASHMPFDFTEGMQITPDDSAAPGERRTQNVDSRTVSPNYFQVMGIPLMQGEFFTALDAGDPTTPEGIANFSGVVVINQALARRFWPNESPVGKRLKPGSPNNPDNPWFVVKGVVADSNQGALDAQVSPEVYFVMSQMAWRYRRMNLAIRTQGDPNRLVNRIQKEIWSLDKDQAVYQVQTMERMVGASIGARRFAMLLLSLFAGLALALATIGIYGVMSYLVTQRTHEIGVRMALGAGGPDVLRLIIRQGMQPALLGVLIGLAGAFALTRLMGSLLFGVNATQGLLFGLSATDPMTYAVIALLLTSVAALACYIPARRATKVDPMLALRCD